MTESALVNKILKALNALPYCKAINVHGNPYIEKGTPDIHATVKRRCHHCGEYPGRSVWLEVKLPAGRLTKIQTRRLDEWEQAGALTLVVRSVEEALGVVRLMEKIWRPFDDECPRCGAKAEVLTASSEDNVVYDGDEARCVECHWPGTVCVCEGEGAWVEWSDEPPSEWAM